jgi:hypothetical protein
MKRINQRGLVDTWLIAFLLTFLLLIGAGIFGFWAFGERNDYKDNVDAKIADAVAVAQKENSDKKDAEFREKEKEPYRTYVGPAAYASVAITYPKTWSAYVDESARGGGNVVDGYFNPSTVPGVQSGNNFAIRVQISGASYNQELNNMAQFIKAGKIKVIPYRPAKVPTVTGVRVDGEIFTGKQGSMIILPVRDKTLKIWTEATQFVGDLDKIILENLTFVP